MIAFADNPSEATESQLEAMGALVDELKDHGADLSQWQFLLNKVERLKREWSVDEIISSDDNLVVLEVATRFRYRGNVGGLPTENELDEMGPLEVFVAKRWMGYKDGWLYSTRDEGAEALETMLVSQGQQAQDNFQSFVEGRNALAKRKGETWDKFWKRWSDYLAGAKKYDSFVGPAKAFRQRLMNIKGKAPQWASSQDFIEWLEARDCTYQCDQSLITASGYWVLSTQVLTSSCRGARRPRSWSAAGRVATSPTRASAGARASGGACRRRTAWSSTPSTS